MGTNAHPPRRTRTRSRSPPAPSPHVPAPHPTPSTPPSQAARDAKGSRAAQVRAAMRRARGLPVSEDGCGEDDDAVSLWSAATGLTGASGLTAATGFPRGPLSRADSFASRGTSRTSRGLHGGPRRRNGVGLGAASIAGSAATGRMGAIASGARRARKGGGEGDGAMEDGKRAP
jgi:hypothetical protein